MADTKSREMEHMVNWTRITTAAQFSNRDEKEGQTMIEWPKKSLNQHVERSEENPERLQQGIGKVNQASQQEGTLEDQATRYVVRDQEASDKPELHKPLANRHGRSREFPKEGI